MEGEVPGMEKLFLNLQTALLHFYIVRVSGFQIQNSVKFLERRSISIYCGASSIPIDFRELPREVQIWKNAGKNGFPYAHLLRECIKLRALSGGEQVHAHIMKAGLEPDMFLCNNLVTMYAKCGNLIQACQVFDEMPERNAVSWTAMIAGFARHGCGEEALKLFCQMQEAGMDMDQFIFGSTLRACSRMLAQKEGEQVHALIVKTGFAIDVFVGSALVDMYAKCGSLEDARMVFDNISEPDVVSWSGLIAAYTQQGYGEEALRLFCEMQRDGIKPNHFTFATVLMSCVDLGVLHWGKQVHAHIIKAGFETYVFVGSSLCNMYAKAKGMEDACYVFEKMPDCDSVCWNAMISGYAQNGYCEEALKLFCQMGWEGIESDQFTFANVFGACASLAALEFGLQLHAHMIKYGFGSDVCVGSALLDMYGKCGFIEHARQIFDELPNQDVVSWNTMIAGYAQHGQGQEALQLFQEMQVVGIKPNHITFVGTISACSHAGLVDEGRNFFDSMNRDHGITPRMGNYACMVDLLGRAGHLDEAENFINQMIVEPDGVVWRALLGACRIHGDMERAKRAAEHALRLDPQDAATYVLLSNMYAASGRWDDVAKIRKLMKDQKVIKEPGCSWIAVKNTVHAFVMGDRSHPLTEEIYAKLKELTWQIKDAGYVMDTSFVMYNVGQEQKGQYLGYHSEKLAVAFGLISTHNGTLIRIFKNLRVCGDCHTAIKFMSEVAGREIVVRDAYRFHHFKDGLCSCRDYW